MRSDLPNGGMGARIAVRFRDQGAISIVLALLHPRERRARRAPHRAFELLQDERAPVMTRVSVPTIGGSTADEAQRSAHDLDRLFAVVYEELRRVAHRHLRAESPGPTLSTTALVHETYLKLASER